MKKKVIACVSAAALALNGSSAFAALYDGYQIDTANETLVIKGDVETSYRKQVTLSLKGPEGERIALTQFNTDKNGGYSFGIDMDECDADWYDLKIYCNGESADERILYYTTDTRNNFIKDMLDLKSSGEVKEFMDIKNPESLPVTIFDIGGKELETVSEKAFSAVLYNHIKDKETLTEEEAIGLMKLSAIIGCVSEGKVSPVEYKEILELPEAAVSGYEKLSEEEKERLIQEYLTKETILSKQDVSAAFEDGVILTLFEGVSSFDDMNTFILNYGEGIGADVSSYSALKQSMKIELCEAVAEKNFSESGKIGDFIDEKIKELKRKASASVSSGGGGGGGGASRPAVTPSPVNKAEEKTESLDVVAPIKVFEDLEGYEWAMDAISGLKDEGIVNGVTGTEFCPGNYVKREELVKMLVAVAEKCGMITENTETEFEDVSKNDWYYGYVMKACASGIANGLGNGRFGAGEFVTREDAAVLIYRTAVLLKKELNIVSETEFSDENKISDYAINSVHTLSGSGIINGVGNGLFAPRDFCNRAQVSKMLYLCFYK